MPTYEYACDACGAQWELEQRITEDPAKKCPKCKKMKARRMISGGNFILKGSGWYADLYHKPAAASAPKGDSEGGGSASSSSSNASESAKSETAKSETKPAKSEAKAESKPEKKASKKASGS